MMIALALLLHLTSLLAIHVGPPSGHEVAILSYRQPGAVLKFYRISDTGKSALTGTSLISDIRRPVLKPDPYPTNWPHMGPYWDPRLEDVVVSPDHHYLACNYWEDKEDSKKGFDSVIRIYDLNTGKQRGKITSEYPHASFDWCDWADTKTLQYNERFSLNKKDPQVLQVKAYDIATGQIRLLRSHDYGPGEDYDPPNYYQRLHRAAKYFEQLGVGPLIRVGPGSISGGFEEFALGFYRSSSSGAVSDDGRYAIVFTTGDDLKDFYQVITEDRKIGKITPRTGDVVTRVKFVGPLLLLMVEHNKQDVLQIWSLHPLKQIGSLPGDVLVD
jgi:hypothetical protein